MVVVTSKARIGGEGGRTRTARGKMVHYNQRFICALCDERPPVVPLGDNEASRMFAARRDDKNTALSGHNRPEGSRGGDNNVLTSAEFMAVRCKRGEC